MFHAESDLGNYVTGGFAFICHDLVVAATYSARLNDLLGNQVQLDGLSGDRTEDGMYRFSFFVNDSLKELSRTDFEGAPKFLDRDQRHFVVGALRNYLDHVGEVYSPPRVTKEAYLQGLKGQIALDLTTGWDFRMEGYFFWEFFPVFFWEFFSRFLVEGRCEEGRKEGRKKERKNERTKERKKERKK